MAKQEASCFPSEDVVFMEIGQGNSALVHLYGGTLISWKCNSIENLYLSSLSVFDNKKAIRGGVPLVFPNFGPWSLGPQHGFARIQRWTLSSSPAKDSNGDMVAVLTLEDNEATRAMWDYKFKLVYTLKLSENSLKTTLTIHNLDTKSFDFTTLLHTYFRVANIDTASVCGLKGLKYTDKVTGEQDVVESRDIVTIDKNYDRVYKDAPSEGVVIESSSEPSRCFELTSVNFPDLVVWNPWDVKAREMGDFDDLGYKEMLCVEVGKVSSPVTLTAGSQFECSQTLRSSL